MPRPPLPDRVASIEHLRHLCEQGIERRGIGSRAQDAYRTTLDRELILSWARRTGHLVTVEENALQGGFGSAVLELLEEERVTGVKVKRLGIPDRYIEQGSQAQLRADLGLDAAGIAAAARAFLEKKKRPALVRVR